MTAPVPHAHPQVAQAAVARAVLIARAAVTLTATAAGLRLTGHPVPLAGVLTLVAATSAAALAALARRPDLAGRPLPVLALDAATVLAVYAIGPGQVAYYCCAAGASALAGVLIGQWALAPAAAYAAVGYATVPVVLGPGVPPELAGFVFAFPIADVLAAAGAAGITAAVARYVELSVRVVASAQRTAAVSERARLARELHDSVSKTLRGVSFAALALPSSLRRHPDLAERLATTVSQGAQAAVRQARDVVEGLRLDAAEEDFAAAVTRICRHWTGRTGVPVGVRARPLDPPPAVRYELAQILREALENVARHSGATRVAVTLDREGSLLRLCVRDDGRGFTGPAGGLGIIGMVERAATVGGTVRVLSTPDAGTSVEARIPVEETAGVVP
ncbi:sensor histidine kinase [Hamadaea tsunoensis]|uniref:sensor histidine kinase n=1 Tax=Hamadaea tsunoensis TaxID=53368 RepID=UPI0012FB707F|nr:sensor histidine kinase [Hamadaea tsunoensis]